MDSFRDRNPGHIHYELLCRRLTGIPESLNEVGSLGSSSIGLLVSVRVDRLPVFRNAKYLDGWQMSMVKGGTFESYEISQ